MSVSQEQFWPSLRALRHLGSGVISTIVKTSPWALLKVSLLGGRKEMVGSYLELTSAIILWALAWAHWSPSNPSLAITKEKNKTWNCRKGKELTSWLTIVCVGKTSTWKWKRITCYHYFYPHLLHKFKFFHVFHYFRSFLKLRSFHFIPSNVEIVSKLLISKWQIIKYKL